MELNEAARREWVEALRSNKYEQVDGVLRNCDGFCALGVFADIYAKKNNIEWDIEYGGRVYNETEFESLKRERQGSEDPVQDEMASYTLLGQSAVLT